jgi:hypothetical protein
MQEEQEQKIPFAELNTVGASIEGKVIRYVETQNNPAVLIDTNPKSGSDDSLYYVGLGTIALKRLFRQAIRLRKIIVGQSNISIVVTEIVPLKSNAKKNFYHYKLTILTDPKDRNTLCSFSSNEYTALREEDFLKTLEEDPKKKD